MKSIYDEIIAILGAKGEKLGMNIGEISYVSKSDPGPGVAGFNTSGTGESITIPDNYMKTAGASNAQEFLDWLRNQ